jgi:hypothetical protein
MAQTTGHSAAKIAQKAVDHVVAMTGRDSEGVTSIEPTDDGWCVGVEVVESRRIPDTADIIAGYEARVDERGNLLSYRRTGRHVRGRAEGG